MKIADLIKVGKISNFAHGKAVLFKPSSEIDISQLRDVFLIFTDDRVRYVTITNVLRKSGQLYLELLEQDVIEEIMTEKKVTVMIDADDAKQALEDYFDPLGFRIIENGQEYGVVENYFFNSSHYVYEISFGDIQYMIPHVDKYIVDTVNGTIYVQNTQELRDM